MDKFAIVSIRERLALDVLKVITACSQGFDLGDIAVLVPSAEAQPRKEKDGAHQHPSTRGLQLISILRHWNANTAASRTNSPVGSVPSSRPAAQRAREPLGRRS